MPINDLIFSTIIITSALFTGLVLHMIIGITLKSLSRIRKFKHAKKAFKQIKGSLRSLLPALCLSAVLFALRFDEVIVGYISHGVILWIIASFGWLTVSIVSVVRDLILERHDIKAQDNLTARHIHTQTKIIGNMISIGIFVLSVAWMLMTFPSIKQVGVSLLASAGVLGVILGFAAQKTLGNFIAGIQIAIAQPIRLDDVVIVENEWGRIEEITLTYVVIRIWDMRRLVVPLSYFIDKPFENWTRVSADILGSVMIYADYTIPVDAVREELTSILNQSEFWDKKTNELQVTNTTDRTVELRALMSAPNSSIAWKLRCEVREKLLQFLQKNFPQSLPRTRVEIDKS